MSGLARVYHQLGHEVLGSDTNPNENTAALEKLGITVYNTQEAHHITKDIDMVVHTAAIKEENPELSEARKLNLEVLTRSRFLGMAMRTYKRSIAVAGMHGKTSTTSMLATIFNEEDLDPTILVGGNLSNIGGNARIGESDEYFIAEACEYSDSFLDLNPTTSIILNIDIEHLDYFHSLDNIIKSFDKFCFMMQKNGTLILNGDDPYVKLLQDHPATTYYFGKGPHNDAVITEEVYSAGRACGSFRLSFQGKDLGRFELSVPGNYQVMNATAAILAAYLNGVDLETIRKNITNYKGVNRRFEFKGNLRGADIYDDYAHHPTEVKGTLETAKKMDKKRILTVFQPHLFSRTSELFDQFTVAFDDSDIIGIVEIYGARESKNDSISSLDIVNKLRERGLSAFYLADLAEAQQFIEENATEGDLIFTMGAGDVWEVGDNIFKNATQTE